MRQQKQPQCLEWACWLVSYREGLPYPEKTDLQNPVPCAGSFSDSEEQFCAWLAGKRLELHLCRNCARSIGVW